MLVQEPQLLHLGLAGRAGMSKKSAHSSELHAESGLLKEGTKSKEFTGRPMPKGAAHGRQS